MMMYIFLLHFSFFDSILLFNFISKRGLISSQAHDLVEEGEYVVKNWKNVFFFFFFF